MTRTRIFLFRLFYFVFSTPYMEKDTFRRSVVFLTFSFDRAIGFYVLQVYVPLTIIVMSSWVSFWLVRYSIYKRSMVKGHGHWVIRKSISNLGNAFYFKQTYIFILWYVIRKAFKIEKSVEFSTIGFDPPLPNANCEKYKKIFSYCFFLFWSLPFF